MRGLFLRAGVTLALVAGSAGVNQPSLASGFLKTKEACLSIGGQPSNRKTEYGYFCSTPKQDAQCVRQNRNDEAPECWDYNPSSKKCEFDEWAYLDDDC